MSIKDRIAKLEQQSNSGIKYVGCVRGEHESRDAFNNRWAQLQATLPRGTYAIPGEWRDPDPEKGIVCADD